MTTRSFNEKFRTMTDTLTTHPVAPLLARLFAEADEAAIGLNAMAAALPPGELARLMRSKTDYLDFYTRLKDQPLPVSRATGALLYMLARSTGAHAIVEFGTSFGLSTLHLAAALRDNGSDGRLVTCEFEPSKVARARENMAAGGLADIVEIRAGDALETLSRDLPEAIDLVLLDGAKSLYARVLTLLAPRLRSGAMILADNADMCPEYLGLVRAPGSGYLSVPIGSDVDLTMKV